MSEAALTLTCVAFGVAWGWWLGRYGMRHPKETYWHGEYQRMFEMWKERDRDADRYFRALMGFDDIEEKRDEAN